MSFGFQGTSAAACREVAEIWHQVWVKLPLPRFAYPLFPTRGV
jgi:hypothetical protein